MLWLPSVRISTNPTALNQRLRVAERDILHVAGRDPCEKSPWVQCVLRRTFYGAADRSVSLALAGRSSGSFMRTEPAVFAGSAGAADVSSAHAAKAALVPCDAHGFAAPTLVHAT